MKPAIKLTSDIDAVRRLFTVVLHPAIAPGVALSMQLSASVSTAQLHDIGVIAMNVTTGRYLTTRTAMEVVARALDVFERRGVRVVASALIRPGEPACVDVCAAIRFAAAVADAEKEEG